MRILLISSAYNNLPSGYTSSWPTAVMKCQSNFALSVDVMREAVRRFDPDLVIAPMLTTAIPADIWLARPCFIITRPHRGPSSLIMIMDGAERWGVTILQANAEMDATTSGPAWSSRSRLLEKLAIPHRGVDAARKPCCWR